MLRHSPRPSNSVSLPWQLIDRTELKHIIDHKGQGGIDMQLVEEATAELSLDVDAGLDFLDCLKV